METPLTLNNARFHKLLPARASEQGSTVDPHLTEPQFSDFPDYPNANFKRSNEIH